MEIKHQVFVSSTYKDLIEERQNVIHALLELDSIPAGMELFPATDEDAWSLIREVIDGCDYFILILAGKYGSIGPRGVSYSEMEYDYAVETGKPVICFLHSQTEELPASKIEKKEKINEKLEAFKEKVRSRHCKFYSSPEDLGGKVSRSLIKLRKKHAGEGWIRGRYAMTDKVKIEFEQMRAKIAELKLELVKKSEIEEIDTSDLLQGKGTIKYKLELDKISSWSEFDDYKEIVIEFSWNEIVKYVGPALQGEGSEIEFKYKLKLLIYHKIDNIDSNLFKSIKFNKIGLPVILFDTIKIQLQALGLIEPGEKRRSVSDNETYWRLTKRGEKLLINLQAIRKEDSETKEKIEETQ